jgi:hypothetical protein
MNLLQAYVHRCHELDLFSQKRTQVRAARLLLCNLLCLGRKWITRIICMANRDQCDWSADYKLFSRSPWRSQDLFTPVVRNSLDYFDPAEPIIIAGDETKCKRAGNKVKRSRWVRDPLSPPFHVNFIKGIRFIMSFKVIRATAPELEVQMVGGAHPTRCVARRSNTPGILASRALRDGCLDHLGASLYLCPRPLSRRLEPGAGVGTAHHWGLDIISIQNKRGLIAVEIKSGSESVSESESKDKDGIWTRETGCIPYIDRVCRLGLSFLCVRTNHNTQSESIPIPIPTPTPMGARSRDGHCPPLGFGHHFDLCVPP